MAKTHSGKWQTLATPDDSMLDQKKAFRALRASRAHPDFSTVIYQESDGHAEIQRFFTPEVRKKQEEQHARDLAQFQANSDESKAERAAKDSAEARARTEAAFQQRTDLLNKPHTDLLDLVKQLVEAKRIDPPAKTSKNALVEAILSAKPSAPNP